MTQAHLVYKRDESYACAVAEVAREKIFCQVYMVRHFCYGDLEVKVLNHKFKDHHAVRLSFIFTHFYLNNRGNVQSPRIIV